MPGKCEHGLTTEFDSLLNSFEQASQAPSPYRHGYAGHRKALIEYVRKLEAAQPTRSQNLADAGYTRRPSLWAMLARDALEMIATPRRPDGTWNHDRESCRLIAAEALGQYDDDAQPAHSDHQPKDPTA